MLRRSPKYAFVSLLALLLWLSAGSYWVSETCCGNKPSTAIQLGDAVPKVPMLVNDASFFSIQSDQSIVFGLNESKPIIYEDVSKSLMKIIEYVKSNPLKRVSIMGLYTKQESKGFEVARNRADSIQKVLLSAAVPPYQIAVQAGQNDNLLIDDEHQIVFNAITFSFSSIAPFKVNDTKNDFIIQSMDNFIFKHGEASLLLEPSQILDTLLVQLAQYLQKHSNRKLVLCGYNHATEKANLALENLGLARANFMRSVLMEAGAPGQQIVIEGREDSRIAVVNNKLYGKILPNPMAYRFENRTALDKKQARNKQRSIERMLREVQVFRFKNLESDNFSVNLKPKSKAFLTDLVQYLALNPKAKVFCVGHSNKTISDSIDFSLASERAVYILKFLEAHGISSSRMEIKSAGSTHPLGETTTQYGQQINRRVDVFVSFNGSVPKLYVFPPKTTIKIKKKRRKAVLPKTPKVQQKNLPKVDTNILDSNNMDKVIPLVDSLLNIIPLDSNSSKAINLREVQEAKDTL